MKTPCLNCSVSCCSEYTVFVSLIDALRIHLTIGLGLEAFIDGLPINSQTRNFLPYSFSLGEKTLNILALKKREKACIFLLEFGQQGRCGVHAARPMVCRCYPFTFEKDKLEEVPEKLCPTTWNLPDEESGTFANHYYSMQKEYLSSKIVFERWNSELLPEWVKTHPPDSNLQEFLLKKFFAFLESSEVVEVTSQKRGARAPLRHAK